MVLDIRHWILYQPSVLMTFRRKDLRIIIAGAGQLGFRTAKLLGDRGHDVVMIEKAPHRCEYVSNQYVATVIEGDATLPSIFKQARPDDADAVAALTDDTPSNLAVCMMAQQFNPSLSTVMRTDPDTGDAHKDLVGDVIFPERAGALLALNAVLGGDVRSLEHAMGNLDIMEVRVKKGAPAEGKTLEEVRFPNGSIVVSDEDGARIARPDTRLVANQRYIVAVEPNVTKEVIQLLRG